MRIVHLANMYGPKSGGLRTAVNALSSQYQAMGHSVLIIVPGEDDSMSESGLNRIVTIKSPVIPYSGGYRIILRTDKVIEAIEAFAPDVIEISDRTTMLRIAHWAKKQGIQTMLFAHERVDGVLDSFLPWLPAKHVLAQKWNAYTARKVSALVATTQYAAQEFASVLQNFNAEKLRVIPLGVDLERFHPSNKSEFNPLNLPSKYLLACTRLSKEKDPLFLLDIARELKERHIYLPIIIAGSGPLEGRMREIIREEELEVQLLGFVSDTAALSAAMAGAEAFLACGPIETFGLAALESLASGTPVLCRDCAAISEVIDVNSGIAIERSASHWVRAILNLCTTERALRVTRARARAEEFSWNVTAESLIKLHNLVREAC